MSARAWATVFAFMWAYTVVHAVLFMEPRQKPLAHVELVRPVDFTVVGCGDIITFRHTSGREAPLKLACGADSVWIVRAD